MDSRHAKAMMDAFYEAKRIRDQMPPLPDGIKPSYINMLDAVVKLGSDDRPVRLSDIADYRNIPRPGVTRTVKEMEHAGLLVKESCSGDGRVVNLKITAKGRELHRKYVTDYFTGITEKLRDVTDEETDEMIRTIHRIGSCLSHSRQ